MYSTIYYCVLKCFLSSANNAFKLKQLISVRFLFVFRPTGFFQLNFRQFNISIETWQTKCNHIAYDYKIDAQNAEV